MMLATLFEPIVRRALVAVPQLRRLAHEMRTEVSETVDSLRKQTSTAIQISAGMRDRLTDLSICLDQMRSHIWGSPARGDESLWNRCWGVLRSLHDWLDRFDGLLETELQVGGQVSLRNDPVHIPVPFRANNIGIIFGVSAGEVDLLADELDGQARTIRGLLTEFETRYGS